MINYKLKKSSVFSKFPKNKPISFKDSIMMLSFSQDKTSFQNSEDTLQRESKCLMDSGSSLQNVQLGDCKRPKRNNLSFCKDNVVKNFVLKFSQFGIKCSTERERVNLFPVNSCL